MRRLLGILRANGAEPELDAMPTVRRAGDLVAELRRTGLDVELHVEGDLDDLPPGHALAAFRILQEAPTNAIGHGLVGMREGVAPFDGTLEPSPTAPAFSVLARFPATGRVMAVRVLLADDQAIVRAGFRTILELDEGIEVVGEAQDARRH